jgi:hypothetical protein
LLFSLSCCPPSLFVFPFPFAFPFCSFLLCMPFRCSVSSPWMVLLLHHTRWTRTARADGTAANEQCACLDNGAFRSFHPTHCNLQQLYLGNP